jgi:ATP-binding cassette subfamily B (MDR/TAP) protein 1
MRAAYLEAVLRQDVAFFDNLGAGEIATRITANMNIVQDGISEKVGLTISGLGSLISAEIIAFITSWRLALVMLCLPVLMTSWMAIIGGRMKQAQTGSVNAYASSSILVDEVISSMRSVIANGSRHRLAKRYDASLVKPMKLDFTAKSLMGTLIGGMLSFMLSAFALAGWAGSRFMANGDVTVSQVVTVLLAAGIAGVGFGMVAPHLQAFGSAGAAANQIFAVIDRKPMTPLASGKRLDAVDGHVVFDKVKLVYPSRRHQLVFDEFSLDIPAGKTTAIVGPSGSGKSTLFSLLERFYSPLRGQILLDGHNIQDLNLQWLRSQIKVVSQETFLFNTTVFQNIAYGLVESDHRTVG